MSGLFTDKVLYIGLYTNAKPLKQDAKMSDVREVRGYRYERVAIASDRWKIKGATATCGKVQFTARGLSWGRVRGYFACTKPKAKKSGSVLFFEHFRVPGYPRGLLLRGGWGLVINVKITAE